MLYVNDSLRVYTIHFHDAAKVRCYMIFYTAAADRIQAYILSKSIADFI